MLGAVANVIAVIQLATTVASLCLKYSSAVKNTKLDIKSLQRHTKSLKTTLGGIQQLLKSPYSARLETSQKLYDTLNNTHSQLAHIVTKLENKPKTGYRAKVIGH